MPQLPRAMRGRDLRGQASENFLGDHLGGLTEELKRRFKDVSVEVVGCAALFSGRV